MTKKILGSCESKNVTALYWKHSSKVILKDKEKCKQTRERYVSREIIQWIKLSSWKKKMHGIQHLFRQQAVDKQSSIDSWHSANNTSFEPYPNDLKPPMWNQGTVNANVLSEDPGTNEASDPLTDRVLEQLHETTLSSSPKSVPTTAKSPSQESCNLGNSSNCSSRWKRSSPDPNKMMMGRSPNIMDNNAKRILSTTPSRRASNHVERVGSPSLSGYPVRLSAKELSATLNSRFIDF